MKFGAVKLAAKTKGELCYNGCYYVLVARSSLAEKLGKNKAKLKRKEPGNKSTDQQDSDVADHPAQQLTDNTSTFRKPT